MPAIAPGLTGKTKMSVFNGAGARRAGPMAERATFFWDTRGYGAPRFDDLLTIRALEDTHTVSLPLDTIKAQVTTTPFVVRPTVDTPTTKHQRACDEITAWLNGGFNANGESFDHFCKQWINDILTIDAGVVELVPDKDGGHLVEMYARDGATFTKNPDVHGRLPKPGSPDPAYYQFGLQRGLVLENPDSISDIVDTLRRQGFSQSWRAPIPFSRDQIVWTEENPRSWSAYGFGRVQKIKSLVEILVNQDRTNLKYFTANEIPDGLLNIEGAGDQQLAEFREYWQAQVAGQQHKLPIVGGKVNWVPFRMMLTDLQFLESQNWYNKLCWMTFGLNQNEVGDLADVNRSTAQEQATTVFRRTTRPLLDLLAAEINTDILPFLEAYEAVQGEVEFAWVITNPDVQAMERTRDMQDLDYGIHTVNEIRQRRGLEPVPWGDMPKEAMMALVRTYPEWAAQMWGNVEDPPERAPGLLGLSAGPSRAKARPFASPPR